MRISPLNLISTPLPVLNSLGLRLRVGLSSEDPMVGRHPTEAYDAYLSVYSPEGLLLERVHLGQIPPNRRRFFDVSAITSEMVSGMDHLAVVHRVPSRLLEQVSSVEDEIELTKEPDYSLFRSLVEYSYPQGGNGSVIYETPPRFNTPVPGRSSSNTLTFTCQIVVSEFTKSYVILVHYSMDPSYSKIANFNFGLYSLSGELVASDRVAMGPFSIKVLDVESFIPSQVIESDKDSLDGQAAYTFVGSSDEASIISMIINASPDLGGVAVEHTHPPQAYLLPNRASLQGKIKADARKVWDSLLTVDRSGR